MIRVEPVTLTGRFVRLEPLEAAHAEDLVPHATPETFRWFVGNCVDSQTAEGVLAYIHRAQNLPGVVPFAVIDLGSGRAIGSTTYMDVRPEQLGLEIGFTWIGEAFRGSRVNPEMKRLLLAHAFDDLGCERVQLKTDGMNLHSQRAIEKLGATKEGILRRHGQRYDGTMRDTHMYSILREEWPAVRAGLDARLGL